MVVKELNLAKDEVFHAKFPNDVKVSLLFVQEILYCDIETAYRATRDIIRRGKRDVEKKGNFKKLFVAEQVWVCLDTEPKTLFGQVSRLVSLILSTVSALDCNRTRQEWSHVCMELLSKEIPSHLHETEVFIPPTYCQMLPGNVRQTRQESIMAQVKESENGSGLHIMSEDEARHQGLNVSGSESFDEESFFQSLPMVSDFTKSPRPTNGTKSDETSCTLVLTKKRRRKSKEEVY